MKQLRDDNEIASFAVLPDEPEPFVPEWPAECPAPGVYEVPYEEYRAWPAINASALKLGYQVSPKHLKAAIDGRLDSDSRARKLGRAIHCRLLEPDLFRKQFMIAEQCKVPVASGTRKGQPCGSAGRFYDADNHQWYCGTHRKQFPDAAEPTDYIDSAEAERIELIVASVFAHKVVKLLRAHGGAEVSIIWAKDGFPCKARLDKWIRGAKCPDTVLDLKKCQVGKATEEALQRSIRDYGWDMQAAWYLAAAESIDDARPLFAWVFLEDNEPFDARPVWASPAMLEVGAIKARTAFDLYKRCVETGRWPGYCEDIEQLDPADWELKRYGMQS